MIDQNKKGKKMKVLIDIPDEVIEKQKYSDYFKCLSPQLVNTIENGIQIPNNATIGDMIKAMFPNEEVVETGSACVYFGAKMRFDTDLWNAQYKKEVEE